MIQNTVEYQHLGTDWDLAQGLTKSFGLVSVTRKHRLCGRLVCGCSMALLWWCHECQINLRCLACARLCGKDIPMCGSASS